MLYSTQKHLDLDHLFSPAELARWQSQSSLNAVSFIRNLGGDFIHILIYKEKGTRSRSVYSHEKALKMSTGGMLCFFLPERPCHHGSSCFDPWQRDQLQHGSLANALKFERAEATRSSPFPQLRGSSLGPLYHLS